MCGRGEGRGCECACVYIWVTLCVYVCVAVCTCVWPYVCACLYLCVAARVVVCGSGAPCSAAGSGYKDQRYTGCCVGNECMQRDYNFTGAWVACERLSVVSYTESGAG